MHARFLPCGVCALDYPFTGASAVGAARLASTPFHRKHLVHRGLARDCHFTGFPEFEVSRRALRIALKSDASAESATSCLLRPLLYFRGEYLDLFKLSLRVLVEAADTYIADPLTAHILPLT